MTSRRECAILERLRHPNIIKYFGMASNAEGQVSCVRIGQITQSRQSSIKSGIPLLRNIV